MIRSVCRLTRPRLALLNGIAGLAGYLLHPRVMMPAEMAGVVGGVTLLAAAGSACNQVQERDLDLLMARTRTRPLPSGDLAPATAFVIGGVCALAGLLLLIATGGWLPALLAMAALAWYLGIYTPLKRRTSLALALGAVCGALPPVIGWCVAGGQLTDFRVIILAGLFFLWQVPHFWLFQRRHAADYRAAGLPLFEGRLPAQGTRAVCRLWLAALAAGALLLPAFGLMDRQVALWYALFPLMLGGISCFRRFDALLFPGLNLFPLTMVVALLAGH